MHKPFYGIKVLHWNVRKKYPVIFLQFIIQSLNLFGGYNLMDLTLSKQERLSKLWQRYSDWAKLQFGEKVAEIGWICWIWVNIAVFLEGLFIVGHLF